MTGRSTLFERQRGVSLIEAVVAMGVMAFGMLAVVGLQATLRANGDLSRQRAEAVRIAQESLEDWRRFVAIETDVAQRDYQEIATDGPTTRTGVNADFQVTRTVPAPAVSPRLKTVRVSVAWTDRTGETQSVELSSTIAGTAPELAGSLTLPPHGTPARQPLGRHRGIPVSARDLGNGTSVFMPPQATAGTVAWVFNNTTGVLTGVCSVAPGSTTNSLTLADVAACSNNTQAQLLRGYVRFAATATAPSAAEAESPLGAPRDLDITLTLTSTLVHPSAPVCFDDASGVAAAGIPGSAVSYFCAIYSNAAGKWSGRSRIVPIGWVIGTATGQFKVCRYTPSTTDTAARNADHPLDYTESGSSAYASLNDQNFLVISAAHTCPTDTPGDAVNSNTRLHQDGSATYSN